MNTLDVHGGRGIEHQTAQLFLTSSTFFCHTSGRRSRIPLWFPYINASLALLRVAREARKGVANMSHWRIWVSSDIAGYEVLFCVSEMSFDVAYEQRQLSPRCRQLPSRCLPICRVEFTRAVELYASVLVRTQLVVCRRVAIPFLLNSPFVTNHCRLTLVWFSLESEPLECCLYSFGVRIGCLVRRCDWRRLVTLKIHFGSSLLFVWCRHDTSRLWRSESLRLIRIGSSLLSAQDVSLLCRQGWLRLIHIEFCRLVFCLYRAPE